MHFRSINKILENRLEVEHLFFTTTSNSLLPLKLVTKQILVKAIDLLYDRHLNTQTILIHWNIRTFF